MTPPFQRPVLDRRVAFDERSNYFPVRTVIGNKVVRQTTLYDIPPPLPLDQGSEGACVGFGWCGQLLAGPVIQRANNSYAMDYYQAARQIDRKEGRYWPSGASVLAGAKVARNRKLITGYRWAFGIDDVLDTLCSKGPVVLGIPWYEGMYETDVAGRVQVNGALVGGHCLVATGFIRNHPNWGGDWVQWVNSWGRNYGVQGRGFISVSALRQLLQNDGEACIANEVQPSKLKTSSSWWQTLLAWWNNI